MADYSIWVLGESNISLTGGVTLDGITQGDGSHLVGEFLTINATPWTEIQISDGGGSDTNFADNDGNQRLDGDQTLDGVSYSGGTRVEAEYQFVLRDPDTGLEYLVVSFNIQNSSPAYATVEGLAFVDDVPPVGVALEVISASEGPRNGGPTAIDQSEFVPLCFSAGTSILTSCGPVPVEDLAPGDHVSLHGGGTAVLRKAFRTALNETDFQANPKLRPVRICAHAMGGNLPARDLVVSRQHRMVVSSKITERMFGADSVLISAIKLTELPGIYVDESIEAVEYFHLLFDQHEVIVAEGTPSESLFTGPEAQKTLSEDALEELFALFPDLDDPDVTRPSALPIPRGALQKKLIARHAKNNKPLLEAR